MKNKVIKIMFLTWILAIAHIMFASDALAAYTYTPDSSGLFDKSILEGIQVMMVATYKTLGNVLMIGHALMCYAIDVDYRSVLGLIEIPNISFLLVGLAIYIVGVFMALSVGMYFVDASLRLGLAIVFMPVSIALWPFPPTSSKFMNNLSTIIRNSMLFVLMSVGIAFAICLIQAGLFEGGSQAFWDAIAEEKTEAISENFSFFSSHILVVGFCLVFGFRILESTVNDYLNSLFSDSMVGSESPMNEMGTQAFGMLAQNAAKPMLSYVGDVATYQTGNLLTAAGDKLTDLSTDEGIQRMSAKYQNLKNMIRNPRQTYNNMMNTVGGKITDAVQSAGETANRAIQATGRGVQNIVDGVSSALPIPMTEEDRQAMLHGGIVDGQRNGGVQERLEEYFKTWGESAENKINSKLTPEVAEKAGKVFSEGGGVARRAATRGASTVAAGAYNAAHAMTGSDSRITAQGVEEGVRDAVETAAQGVQEHVVAPVKKTAQKVNRAVKDSAIGQAATAFREGVGEGFRGSTDGQPTTPTAPTTPQTQTTPQTTEATPPQTPTTPQTPEVQQASETVLNPASPQTPTAQTQAAQSSRGATPEVIPTRLKYSPEILDPFMHLENPMDTIPTLRRMAQSNVPPLTGAENSAGEEQHVVIKNIGKGVGIFVRKGTRGAGNILQHVGGYLKRQPSIKAAERRAQGEESLWAKWNALGEEALLEKERLRDKLEAEDTLHEDMKG